MINVREAFALTLLSSAKVLAPGGTSVYGILAAAELYTP
jgi:hypothetical protein